MFLRRISFFFFEISFRLRRLFCNPTSNLINFFNYRLTVFYNLSTAKKKNILQTNESGYFENI